MRSNNFVSGFIALVLAVVIALAGIGCLTTGFQLPVRDLAGVILPTVFLCGFYLLFSGFRSGKLVFAAMAILLLSILLRHTDLLTSIEALLYRITLFYNRGYGWGIIHWSKENLSSVSLDGGLALVAASVGLSVCACVRDRAWVGSGLLAALLPLFACCVVTDTIPDDGWLWLLLTALAILTLTHLSRRDDTKNANRLMALILIPAVVASALLFRFSTPDNYRGQLQGLHTTLEQMVDQFLALMPDLNTPGPSGSQSNGVTDIPDRLDLTTVGPQTQKTEKAMEVTVTRTNTQDTVTAGEVRFYFRGRSYDTYTGTGWRNQLNTEGEGGWPNSGMSQAGSVTIKTFFKADTYYFPYYPPLSHLARSIRQGALPNSEMKQTYTFTLFSSTGENAVSYTPLSQQEQEVYTYLEEDTLQAAQAILSGILSSGDSSEEKVEKIAAYIRSSAKYDLQTEQMPENEKDFVIWFLEDSDTGYCTHFASAAAVLLRAAGIPARYVVGYQASMRYNTTVTVTEDQSHAWVEYLHPNYGWTVLEATPGFFSQTDDPQPTEPSTEPSTEPTETAQPTEPSTEPTEMTRPSENTRPNDLTRPTGTTAPPTTEPTEPTESPDPGNQGKQWNLEWVRYILWLLAAWALLMGQDRLRKQLRLKRMTQGDPNRQALARWRYAKLLSRLTGLSAAALLPLAEKAAFSQYTLTGEELSEFDSWIHDATALIDKKSWLLRKLIRFVYAIQ